VTAKSAQETQRQLQYEVQASKSAQKCDATGRADFGDVRMEGGRAEGEA